MKTKNKKPIMDAEPAFNPHECDPVQDSTNQKEELNSSAFSTLWVHYKAWHEPLIKDVDWTQEMSWSRNKSSTPLNKTVILKLKNLAQVIYKDELTAYDKYERQHGGREVSDREKMLKVGAKSDKRAQMAAKIMQDPVHSLNFLEELINALEKDKDAAIHQLKGEFKEMFKKSVLPGITVAIPFEKQSLGLILTPLIRKNNPQQAYKDLVCWHYLDQVATLYTRMVNSLSKILQIGDAKAKLVAIDLLSDLLGDHPNQDTDLILEILVNKVGDTEKEVANKASRRLKELINKRRCHLKSKTVDNCAQLIYRANMKHSAKVRIMSLLNEILFKVPTDVPLMKKMLSLYYGTFTACIKEGDINTKMISHVLTGVKRIINILITVETDSSNYQFLVEHQNVLFKMCKMTHFKVAVQCLKLLYDILPLIEKQGPLVERYECVLYEFILHKELGSSTFTRTFLNLVYKTMIRMSNKQSVNAFAKRLLQVAFYKTQSHVCIAMLYLVIQVSLRNPSLKEYIKRSIRGEEDKPEEKKDLPLANIVSNITNGADSDDDEKFHDLDIDETGKTVVVNGDVKPDEGAATWLHRGDGKGIVKSTQSYDPRKNNPRYCGVNHTELTELSIALEHHHPTVRSFATSLINDQPLSYRGQPFEDFKIKNFLDKCVNKKPKKEKKSTLGTNPSLGSKVHYQQDYMRSLPADSDEFLKKNIESVPPECRYLYKYYKEHVDTKKKKSSRTEINDEEFDEYLTKAGGRDGAVQLGFDDGDESTDDELDFASNVKRREERNESDEEDFEDMEESDDDEEMDDDDDDIEEGDDILGSDDECDEFSDEDDVFTSKTSEALKNKKEKKKKLEVLKSKKGKMDASRQPTKNNAKVASGGRSLEAMMVDAEEYGAMFQEYETRAPQVTSDDFVNTSKIGTKQLKWEKRNISGKGKSNEFVSKKKGQSSKKKAGRGKK